jgi:hypothetical protein
MHDLQLQNFSDQMTKLMSTDKIMTIFDDLTELLRDISTTKNNLYVLLEPQAKG